MSEEQRTEQDLEDKNYLRGFKDGKIDYAKLCINVVRMYGVLGFNRGECKACHRTIWWARTKNNAPMPLNDDMTSHFSTCPKADTFRKEKG